MSAPDRPMSDAEIQDELYRLDAYRAQLNAMLQQHQILANSRVEHLRARETLESLEKVDASTELLLPLGGETFVRGSASPSAPVLLGIGSGIVVEVDRPRAAQILADRIQKIEAAADDLEGQMRSLDERVRMLSQRLDALSQSGGAPAEEGVGDVVRD